MSRISQSLKTSLLACAPLVTALAVAASPVYGVGQGPGPYFEVTDDIGSKADFLEGDYTGRNSRNHSACKVSIKKVWHDYHSPTLADLSTRTEIDVKFNWGRYSSSGFLYGNLVASALTENPSAGQIDSYYTGQSPDIFSGYRTQLEYNAEGAHAAVYINGYGVINRCDRLDRD